jgi:signal transduction histidine kinase
MSWENLASALDSAQGSTFYALLVLVLLSAASLVLQRRARPAALDPAVSTTIGLLIGLRVVEALVAAAAWLAADQNGLQALPPLERAIHLASLASLGWLWARVAEVERGQQTLFGLLQLLGLSFAALMMLMWLFIPAASTFNYTDLDYAWTAVCLVTLAVAAVQIFKSMRILGLIMMGILFLGQIVHLLLAEPFGNMPLAAQIANILSLPVLFLLPVGSSALSRPEPAADSERVEEEAGLEPEEAAEEPFPDFFDFDAVPALMVNEAATADELAQLTAQQFEADICTFAHLDEINQVLTFEAGYNVLRSAPVEPATIALSEVPQLRAAIAENEPARFFAEDRSPELGVMSQALRLSFPGHMLTAPLPGVNEPGWAVLLLSIERPWQLDDESKLTDASAALSSELNAFLSPDALVQPPAEPPPGDPQAAPTTPIATTQPQTFNEDTRLQQLESENERYRADVERLLAHIDEIESGSGEGMQPGLQSNEVVQALQMENERLKSSLAELESAPPPPAIAPISIEASQAREELRLALGEVAALHEQLAEAQRNILLGTGAGALAAAAAEQPASLSDTQPMNLSQPDFDIPTGRKINPNQVDVVASIAQELRQPLSSVVGYTDLLLGESVGILGALQRKFLERVRSSADRMNTLIDNLIRIAELDESGYSAVRKPVDLSSVIDDTIGQLRTQLQEKRIAMRVDLPPVLPQINTDRDALQQILYHLLQNADGATPAEGSITLRAILDKQKDLGEFVLIQVSDTGGGIPDADLPRVFSRVYRASNPVIPGVGDTGVGLTIAETLTQALGGRIWVESEAGQGATFSVLLPLDTPEAREQE